MYSREFYCNRDDFKIYVKEIAKEAPDPKGGRHPVLIISHGFGGNHAECEVYCRHFAELGYITYCYDFCGGTQQNAGRSDGSSLDMTITTERRDLETVIREVQGYAYADKEHITLMGFSQGGFISALTAGKLGEQIDNLILIFPALCIPDHARLGCLGGASYERDRVPEVIVCRNGMHISRKLHEDVIDMDPYREISAYKGPVLIIHGLQDSVVNYAYSVKAANSYEKGQCHLILMEAADHGFDAEHTESAWIAIEHFLQKKQELLTIKVILTGAEQTKKTDEEEINKISFTGYCRNDLFMGCIVPEGIDTQTTEKGKETRLSAEYTLLGVDREGKTAHIHILNQKQGDRYKPRIEADTPALAFLKDLDLTASLEGYPNGLTVRIFG